jgi:hypothetical protein
MAGGYKLWSTGEVVTATNLQSYIQNQTVMVFADSTARTTALSGVVSAGMISYLTGTNSLETYNGSAWVAVSSTPTLLTNVALTGALETCNVVASAATGTINVDAKTSTVWYYTSNASANFTLNFRGNSGTTLASVLSTGQSITIVFLNTNGSTAYYPTAFQVDGSSVTPKWQGGSAPSAGNISAVDAYSLTIIKTASAPTYTVIGSQTKFA